MLKPVLFLFAVLNVAAAFGAPAVDRSKLPAAATRKIDFAKDIQPIFEKSCYGCHSSKKEEAGFRLDQKSDALKGGELGVAIVPGQGSESLLVHAVSGLKEDLVMPKKGERLSSEQVGLLRAWIDQGANWPENAATQTKDPAKHWAFKAPVRPAPPGVKNKKWVRNPIDHFVLARLEKESLKPAVEAEKIALLRRLNFDLIGIPPTIAEVDAFLADRSPGAYEKQVERLMASPHYGERWGRHWLDAARYADSDGFEKDKARFIWFYRDWVINAFNRNLSYDQFIVRQIAGDQLPNATQDDIVATGFLRNSMLNEEGGVDPEQFRMDAMFDRMDAIGKSVLGLTIQCAQCHSHKFDPLSQEEYYRLFAFLNNDYEGSKIVYTPGEWMQIEKLRRQTKEIEAKLQETTPDWQERMTRWEKNVKDETAWEILPAQNAGDNGTRFTTLEDGSIISSGYQPTKWSSSFRATNHLSKIGAFRLECLPHPDLPSGGPGRSIKGMLALSEFMVEAEDPANPTNKVKVKFAKATADFSNSEKPLEPEFYDKTDKKRVYGPIAYAIDGNGDTAWGIDAGAGRRNVARQAIFIPEHPIEFTNGVVLNIKLQQNHGGWNSDDNQNHNLGRFRLSVTTATNVTADSFPAAAREIAALPRERRTPAQTSALFEYFRVTVPEWKEANEKLEALWREWPEGATTLTLDAREKPRQTALLRRGDWLKPGNPVSPGVPKFLHSLPEQADSTRLTFGKWLVDRRSPTTARVFVNRLWQIYFGIGLVTTAEDLGMQSEAPSHPELLDWLATEFMDSGWDIKHMHRLIVTSATYRQSSKVTPELYTRDQYNRLLARGPRFRVEGEVVRDVALAASGLLNPAIGGPSVYPPIPEFLTKPPASYGPYTWPEETGTNRYRRAVYTFRRRSTPYPMLQAFDAPNADFSCVRRVRSNSPVQALMTLNETIAMECAQGLASTVLAQGGGNDSERIDYAFRRVLSRPPTANERKELLDYLERQRQRIAEGWVNARELASGTNAPPSRLPKGTTPTQLAAYTAVSRVLLNLDEAITKE